MLELVWTMSLAHKSCRLRISVTSAGPVGSMYFSDVRVANHTLMGGASLKAVRSETTHRHDSTADVHNHLLKNEGENLKNRGCTTWCHKQDTSQILGQSD